MVKKLFSFAGRLLMLNAIAVLLAVFIMLPIISNWNNAVFGWIITILFSLVMLGLVWVDAVNSGTKDAKNDKIARKVLEEGAGGTEKSPQLVYRKWFGFAGGALAQAMAYIFVAILAYVLSATHALSGFLAEDSWAAILTTGLKLWNMTYLTAFMTFENAAPVLFPVLFLLFVLSSGFGYLNGPVQQRRLETIIERNKARKAKRVQDDLKNKKKPLPKKPGIRN
jgi:uncharacterized protein YacL